jgi:hypothetical protein
MTEGIGMATRVFISYSHDTEDHKRNVLGFADQLRAQGVDCILDQYEESPVQGWPHWMEAELCNCHYVLVVCTKGYCEKLATNATVGGKGVKWEGAIITQEIYEHEGRNRRFIPVLFGEESKDYIPRVLRSSTHYDVFDNGRYERLYRRLTQQPKVEKPSLGKVVIFPIEKTRGYKPPATSNPTKNIQQTITGNNNIQVGAIRGNLNIRPQAKTTVKILPPPGTIGANPLLQQAIKERFNKLGEEREKRFGKNAYSAMYNTFKKDFDIKNDKWTAICNWPEATADTKIRYLDAKYANTISGRLKNAIVKGTFVPTKGHSFAREKELLAQLDLEIASPQVKEYLKKYFEVESHTKLSRTAHWQWVLYLEQLVQKMFGE